MDNQHTNTHTESSTKNWVERRMMAKWLLCSFTFFWILFTGEIFATIGINSTARILAHGNSIGILFGTTRYPNEKGCMLEDSDNLVRKQGLWRTGAWDTER